MNKLKWNSPELTKHQRENIEILTLKGTTGPEGGTSSPS